MVLLVSLIHKVRPDMFSHGGIKNLFLDSGMDFQLRHRLGDDAFLLGRGFCFLELVEKLLHRVMVLLED